MVCHEPEDGFAHLQEGPISTAGDESGGTYSSDDADDFGESLVPLPAGENIDH